MHVYVLLSALLICIPVKAFDDPWTKVFKKPRKGFNTKTQVDSSNPKRGPQRLSATNLAVHTSLLGGKTRRRPEHLIKAPIKPKKATKPATQKKERVLFTNNGDRIRTTLSVKPHEIVITPQRSKQRKKRR